MAAAVQVAAGVEVEVAPVEAAEAARGVEEAWAGEAEVVRGVEAAAVEAAGPSRDRFHHPGV